MAYEQKNNSGSLFKNDRREKDSHPHATGSALIDGVEYWVSAWTKDGAKGKFQSLSFTKKEDRKAAMSKQADANFGKTSAPASSFDDEVPFAPEWRG